MYNYENVPQSVCHEYVFFLFIIYENAKAAVRAIRKKKEKINEEDYDKISLPDIDNNNFDLLPYDKNLKPLIITRIWRGTPSKDLVKMISEGFIHNEYIKASSSGIIVFDLSGLFLYSSIICLIC